MTETPKILIIDNKVESHDLLDINAHSLGRIHVLGCGLPGQAEFGARDEQIDHQQANGGGNQNQNLMGGNNGFCKSDFVESQIDGKGPDVRAA